MANKIGQTCGNCGGQYVSMSSPTGFCSRRCLEEKEKKNQVTLDRKQWLLLIAHLTELEEDHAEIKRVKKAIADIKRQLKINKT